MFAYFCDIFADFYGHLGDPYYQAVLAGICTVLLLGALFILKKFCNIRRKVAEVKEFVGVGSGKPRFRKRDKVMFYGIRMLRKVKSMSNSADRLQKNKKRQMVIKFAKKLLRLRKENQPLQLQVKEPPLAYLEPDLHEGSDNALPPEVQYMLRCIRIFGHFDKPMFLELYKHLESRFLFAGQYLFRIGDQDDSIFVVQSGRLNISLIEPDGSELALKTVLEGDSVSSFLSFIDILIGQPSYFKTVCAKAEVDTIILRLPLSAFSDLFARYPEYLVRVIQIIMVRLHRVSFTALYQYLGLTSQLVNSSTPYRRTGSGSIPMAQNTSPKPSPSRSKEHVRSVGATSAHDRVPIHERFGEDGIEYSEHAAASYSNSVPTDSDANLAGGYGGSSHGWVKVSTSSSMSSKLPNQEPVRKKRRSQTFEGKTEPGDVYPTNALRFAVAGCNDQIDYMRLAIDGIKANLSLDDDELLNGRVEIRDVSTGTYLIRQESSQDAALIYTLTGCLLVSQKLIDKNQEVTLYYSNPGEVIGGLAVISGEPSYFTVRARQPSRVAVISKDNFYNIMRERPRIVLQTATSIIRRLSPFVRQIDFALDWKHIESGKALYSQDDASECMYIVLSGRLRSVITHANGKKELVGEYGKGDLVGIVELLTQTKRSTSVIAVRDTELAIMPEGLLNTIKIKYPVVVTRLVHLLSHRILGSWQRGNLMTSRPSVSNFSTVAILAVNEDVPLSAFTMELHHSISGIGTSMRLTSDLIRKMLGSLVLDRSNEFRLSSWLGQQEDHHRVVLYQCDSALTPWTLRCIRQADVILIVALAEQEPTVGRIEKQLESLAIRTQKELILLHRETGTRPRDTVAWLNMRTWCSSHHHICCPKRMFAQKSATKMAEMYSRIGQSEPNIHSDFSRLARFLTGTSIGLVLGGGGARGCAHVGMIRAIIESGIPIDMVGGVSIGSFMGALWCMEKDLTTFTQKAREWARKMTSVWGQIYDLTYPVTSLFTGAGFNRTIIDVFRDTQIEDLWLPYFAVTTDITESRQRVHTHGSLWRFVRGSMSLSGFMPPICMTCESVSCESVNRELASCGHTHLLLDGGYVNNLPGPLWQTVRASMSICGLVPPLCLSCECLSCDTAASCESCGHGHCHLLVDGAYVNNLPADVMRSQGASQILAIDVGSQDDCDHTNYGDQLSGWWLLWKRFNPWAKPVKVPNLAEIQSRLAYVSCVRQLEEVKRYDSCVYIRPPIDKYKTLQFGSFDEIRDVGYNYGKIFFEEMAHGGALPGWPVPKKVAVPTEIIQQNYVRETTFTDLAEMVCRIKEPSKMSVLSEYSDDDEVDDDGREDGYQSEPPVSLLTPDDKEPGETPLHMRRRNTAGSLTELELSKG